MKRPSGASSVTLLWYLLLLTTASGSQAASAQPLTLDQVVSRAADRAKERENARVSTATANQRYLESQSKFRFELRPRVGLLAFSTPALLASSLGFGMLLGQDAPSPWARQNARLDTIAAEIGMERGIMLAERDALSRYFSLLQRQKAADEMRDLLEQRRAELQKVSEKAKAASATAVDSAVLERGVITAETQWEGAETDRQMAAYALGELLGLSDVEDLRVADLELPQPGDQVPTPGVLYSAAMRKGNSRVALREKLEAEKKPIFKERAVRMTAPSASYANIGDRAHSRVGLGQGGLLLGGNTGSFDLGLLISPRARTENAALAAATTARINSLELELADLDDSVRANVDTLRLLVVSTRHKAEQAARELDLTDRIWRLTSVRERNELESSQAVITAEMDVSRARADLRQAESERNTAWNHLLVACGLGGTGTATQKRLTQEQGSGKLENIEEEELR